MKKLAILAALAAFAVAARAERGGIGTTAAEQAGVDIEDSVLGQNNIKMVRTRFVDPGAIFNEDGAGVVSLGRKRPEGKHIGAEKKIGFDDKQPPPAEQKLTDPFPTGVKFGGVDGLMQSQNDAATGNVAKITIPGDPPTTMTNPLKMDNTPLTQKDLMDLGQGKVQQIQMKDGRVLKSPSAPQSG